MKEEKFCQHPITKEYFMVSDYKDLGDGKFIAQNKRKATKEEIKQFALNVNGEVQGWEVKK